MVLGPTPQSRSTSSGWRNASSCSGGTSRSPSGLPTRLATLARNLVRATPTVIGSPTRSRTAARSAAAMSTGAPDDLAQATDVEERLVDRERLDQRCGVVEHREDGAAGVGVRVHAGRHHDRVGTQGQGLPAVHRAPHAAGPGLVAGRHHDAAPDDDRPAPQLRVVALLDRREEGVEVGMQDAWRSDTNTCSHSRSRFSQRRQEEAVRSHVVEVTPWLRSSCLRTRIDASVRGRSSTTST